MLTGLGLSLSGTGIVGNALSPLRGSQPFLSFQLAEPAIQLGAVACLTLQKFVTINGT